MKKVPRLRFRGFQEDWELCKLDDLLNEVKRPVKIEDHKEYQLVTVKRRNGGVVSRGNFKGENILVKNYFVLKKNDYLISKRQVVHGANGIVPENMDGAVVSNEYLVSVGNESIKTDYLTIISQLPQMYKLFFLSSYGIDIEKLVFNVEDWKKRTMLVPNIDEQVKIASFFKIIDDTITLHQRKLDQLKELKKAYLQLMFPKKDEPVPRIRFADFEEEWELCKLGEIFKERSDRSGEGELISVTINSGIIKASELERKDNSSTDKSNYKVVKQGDIAYNSMRMWQGASGFSPFNGILSPAYTVISPKENIDGIFMAYMFKKHDMIQVFKRNSQGLTSDTWNLKFPTLSTIKIKMPLIEEQKKIAKLLLLLDKTIAIKQNKLNQLKALKKAYLQNMFI
nr:restriction endonuclease subunit S [Enterococcus faecalis]